MRFGFFAGIASFLCVQLALAQTRVSTRVSISGSCSSCDLSRRVMPDLTLQGSNFSGSDFSHSNLSGGKFHRSNLEGASFYKAYLMRVNGEGTNLRGAILRDATLIEAKLIDSDISRCDLRRADMSKGDFSKSRFLISNLIGVDAVNAKFVSSNFAGAKLDHSDFTGADFTNAVFENVKFGDAIFKDAILKNVNLSGANLEKINGVTQKQLSQACGSAATKLPEHLSIPQCTNDHHMDIILSSPPTWSSSSQKFTLVQIQNNKIGKPSRRSERMELVRQIDATLRLLPQESPLHKQLYKQREQLMQAKRLRKRQPVYQTQALGDQH